MTHVFISYKHEDDDFAANLIRKVEDAGFKTWMDHDHLRAGEDWREAIDQAINTAFVVVVIMTPDARLSEYVTYEWASALGVGVRVLPVLLRPTGMHPRLEGRHYLDFTNRSNRPWEDLIKELRQIEADYRTNGLAQNRGLPPYVQQALTALDSFNADERRLGIESLAQTNDPAARDALVLAIQHAYPDVRILAALHLAQGSNYKDERAVPGLLDGLNDHRNWQYRELTARALGEMRHRPALHNLLDRLHDEEWRVRQSVVRALGQMGDASAVDSLLEALWDEDGEVRQYTAEALGEIGSPAAVDGLLEVLRDDEWRVREAAACALGRIGDLAAVPGLNRLLHDPIEKVWQAAACALGEIGDPAAVPGLLNLLSPRHRSLARGPVRPSGQHMALLNAVSDALAHIGIDAMPGLIEVLHNSSDELRWAAALTLGRIGSRTVPGLLDTLQDPDWSARQGAAWALGIIRDAAAVPGLLNRLDDADGEVRVAAAAALGEIGDPASVPGLLRLLHHEFSDLSAAAAEALAHIGLPAVPGLLRLLYEGDGEVRAAAAEALGHIGEPALEGLVTALHHSIEEVRWAAVEALGAIGTPAVPSLVEALRDPSRVVREAATAALGKIGE